jgi:hypothetical protein
LPRARQRILHGVFNFLAADMTPATLDPAFQPGDYFHGGQMRVELPGYAEKPVVNAFTGTRRHGQHFVNEWRQGFHCAAPFCWRSSAASTLGRWYKIRRPIFIEGILPVMRQLNNVRRLIGSRTNITFSSMKPEASG